MPRVIHTATFRLAAVYALMFAAGAMMLVLVFDLVISDYARRALRDDLRSESQLLVGTSQGQSREVARLVQDRERTLGDRPFLYLVLDGGGRRLAGSLPMAAAKAGSGQLAIPAPADSRETSDETAEVRTIGVRLRAGGLLVVGRSTYAFHELRETMEAVTQAAAAVTTLVSLLIALVVSRRFLSRIDRVTEAAERIMEGRLQERLPTLGAGDEFDRLGSSLNAMLDRIEALMEGLQQVSADIAHDLRTPLTRLRRRLDDALQHEGEHPARDVLARETLAQVDEILATFGALLRIAQVEAGARREAFRHIDLSEISERVRQAYEPVAEDCGKRLVSQHADPVVVAGDEELLTQLISNLVENAFTHAAGEGDVDLMVRVEGGRALLSVRDHGPGVPEAERAKVLRRLYRLDRSRTTPGAGLGLSMAQAIAQLHGAKLELADNGPGLAANVWFPLASTRRIENR